MTWTYHQANGQLYHDGKFMLIHGYSGKGVSKNKPAAQNLEGYGPLPRGKYTITHPFHHPKTGPYSMRLVPAASNQMFGRSHFLIHGDSLRSPGNASDGCIILPINIRTLIWGSGDHVLEVVQ